MSKTIYFDDIKIITLPRRSWNSNQNEESHTYPYSMVLTGTYDKPGNSICIQSDQEYDLGDIIHLKVVEGAGGNPTLIYFIESESIGVFDYRLEWKPPYTKQEIVGLWSIVSNSKSMDSAHFIEESIILSKEVDHG